MKQKSKKSFKENFNGKVGFTLAEVLITLSIIGVVAALTIPALQKNVNTIETTSKVKEIYSILSQATSQIKNDNGNTLSGLCSSYANYSAAATLCVSNLYASYLQYTQKCDTTPSTNGCWAQKTYWMDKTTWWTGDHPIENSAFILKNAMAVTFYKDSDGVFGFTVDTNGPNKGPNADGLDVFEFETNNDMVRSYQGGTDCSGQGRHCAGYYLLQ